MTLNVNESHIAELRKQLEAMTTRADKLQRKVDAHPVQLLEAKLVVREEVKAARDRAVLAAEKCDLLGFDGQTCVENVDALAKSLEGMMLLHDIATGVSDKSLLVTEQIALLCATRELLTKIK